jgi:fructoselysine 6-kinase
MPNLSVAVVGDNTIDRYLGARQQDYIGGNAVNVAVQLAERGVDVRYYGAVGPDRDGELVRAALATRHVDVDGLITVDGATAVTLIRVDDTGERHLEEERFGVTAEYFPTDTEVAEIAEADWVQIGMLTRASDLRTALRAARRKLRIGQDCSVAAGYRELSVAFKSASAEQGRTEAEAALAGGAALAVVTLGADGALALAANQPELNQHALPIDAVDTTGAGDSFIAGFVASYLQSLDVAAAMASGAAWAARTCTHVGGFPQDPMTGSSNT